MKIFHILLIEDSLSDARFISEMIMEISLFQSNLISVLTLKEGCDQIQKNSFDIILLDLNLPDSTGQQTLEKVLDCCNEVPVVLITGIDDEELSLKLIKEGAQDYFTKQSLSSSLLGKSILYSIERKQNEKKLKDSESRFRELYENAKIGLYRTTHDGTILMANKALVKMLGYPSFEKLAEKNLEKDDYKTKYERAEFLEKIEKDGEINNLESTWIRLDGSEFFVHESARAIRDTQGKTLYYDGVVEDFTERKQAEDALKNSESKFRKLFESTPVPLCYLDSCGVITLRNDRFITVFGYDEIEVPDVVEWWLKAYPNEEYRKWVVQNWNSAVKHAAETGTDIESDEYHVTCKDGTVREIIISGITIKDDLLATFIDITGRKKEEDKLIIANKELAFQNEEKKNRAAELIIANKELAFQNKEKEKRADELIIANKELGFQVEVNKVLEQFTYVVSHNLQEPLRTVSNYLQVFEEDYSEIIDDTAIKYLHLIDDSTKRMSTLLNTLADISRLGRNIKLTNVDCKKIIDEVIADLDTLIKTSNAIIEVKEMPVLNVYEVEMRQLFQNLITNAIKFQKKNIQPKIQIRSEKIDENWKFSVIDNGIGIDPVHFERIFDIFQRLQTDAEYEGNGIGLSNCKKIVQLHHGEIWIESNIGQGSTFHFTIPNLAL